MQGSPKTETYYPPRAGLLTKLVPSTAGIFRLCRKGQRAARKIYHHALQLVRQAFLLAIPGRWMRSTPAAKWGRLLQWAWVTAMAVFGVWMGSAIGNLAYAAMISLHSSSVISFVSRLYPQRTVLRQVLQALGTVLLVGQVLYPAGLFLLERFVCMPARLDGKVLVINCLPWAQKPRVGDRVVFRTVSHEGKGYVALGGLTGGQILAGPGSIRFSKDTFETESGPFPRLQSMPTEGNLQIEPGNWFIWPKVDATYAYANELGWQMRLQGVARPQPPEGFVSQHLLKISCVPANRIVGKPFKYWLWRRQIE